MIRPTTAVLGLALLAASAVPVAQSRPALTTADYDRATRMLAPALAGLVLNDTVMANWLPDGRFCIPAPRPQGQRTSWSTR